MFPIKDNVPTKSFPLVTLLLIATNVAVFVFYELPDFDHAVNQLAYHPCEVTRECPVVGEDWHVTAITSMFMHGDWLHLGGNMLFLWIFGNHGEDAMGKIRYLVFDLLGGLAATAAQTAVTLSAGNAEIPNLGASGAVSAVLGAYLVLLPNASVVTVIFALIFFIREFPAWLFLGFWFVFQLFVGSISLLSPEAGGGVAFFAHIGGFVFGVLTVGFFAKRRPLQPAY